MNELPSSELFQRFLSANISIFTFLGLIPAIRNLFGIIGIGICSCGFSLYLTGVMPSASHLQAIKTGIFIGVPILISYELIAAAAKSLEILRGSQMAEQLFVQERGGPIEFFLFLFFGTLFLSNNGGELLLTQLINHSTQTLFEVDQLQSGYHLVLGKVFALAGLGVVLELVSGLVQRVSRKGFLGAEVSTLRVPLAIFFLVTLLEGVA